MTMLVKKAFISSEFIPSVSLCPLPWAFLFSRVLQKENFPIKQKRSAVLSDMEYPFGYTKHNTATPKSAAISNPMQKNVKKP